MNIRFYIDDKGIVKALRETRRRIDASIFVLTLALCAIAAGLASCAWIGYRAVDYALTAPTPMSLAALGDFSAPHTQAIARAAVCAAAFIGLIIAARRVFQSRKKRRASKTRSYQKPGLATGLMDFSFSKECVVVKSQGLIRKTDWRNFTKIEKKKNNLIFWRKDGSYEFIPLSSFDNNSEMIRQIRIFAAAIAKQPKPEEALGVKTLSIVYEYTPGDDADFIAFENKRLEGLLFLFRRLFFWPPLRSFFFLCCALISAAAFFVAATQWSAIALGIGLGAASAAIATFALNLSYFCGPGFPLRKDKNWPYAQTALTRITLSKTGIQRIQQGYREIIQWSSFEGYYESKLVAYLVLAPGRAIAAPKRAFVSESHFNNFTAFAKSNIVRAQKERKEQHRQRLAKSLNNKGQERPTAARSAA